MSPDEINTKHGRPSWRCWHCEAENGLKWWNGLSVAVCVAKPECGEAYSVFLADEIAKEEAYSAFEREYLGLE